MRERKSAGSFQNRKRDKGKVGSKYKKKIDKKKREI